VLSRIYSFGLKIEINNTLKTYNDFRLVLFLSVAYYEKIYMNIYIKKKIYKKIYI